MDDKARQDTAGDSGQDEPGSVRSALMPRMAAGVGSLKIVPSVSDDVIERAASQLTQKGGSPEEADQPPAPAAFQPRRGPRPKSPVAPELEIPFEGENVDWKETFRAEIPTYVFRQIEALGFRERRTAASILLNMLHQHRDEEGRQLFYIRREDMVPDRRKVQRRR